MKLLEPITFANGRLRSKNRVVMPPMGMGYAHEDGRVSDKVIEYYRARAASGVGMMVVENCIIDPDVLGVGPELQLHSEIHLPGLKKLAEVIKGFGALAGLQLNHMGRQTTLGKPVAPSPFRFLSAVRNLACWDLPTFSSSSTSSFGPQPGSKRLALILSNCMALTAT